MSGENPKKHDQQAILKVMEKIPFFRELLTEEKERIVADHARIRHVGPQTPIIRHGGDVPGFYVLLKGTAVVVEPETGTTLARLTAGQVFGEFSFLTGRKPATDVIAEEAAIVLRIDRRMMNDQMGIEIREKIKDRLIRLLVKRIEAMNKKVGNLSRLSDMLIDG